MNTALWVVQGLVAFAMLGAGTLKVVKSRTDMVDKFKWAATWSDGAYKMLGLAEVLGGIGLIVPWVTGIVPVLTPIAAVCLFVLMAGAVKTHIDFKEPWFAPAILAALCVFIAIGRFGLI